MAASVVEGDLVLIAKQKATVRYVGPVDGHEGITWVGVEWHDPSRGKHDGSIGGKRYFTCSNRSAATPASFVRINKVSPGTSLVEALVLRYTNQLAEGSGGASAPGSAGAAAGHDAQQHAYVSTASNRKLWVELVGQEQVTARQSKLELLASARLVGANVSSVGPPGKLAATAPSLQQLDLTDNLIGSWATIISICQQLPSLHLLNLSHNRLQLPARLPDAGLQQLPGLQCLVLNHCNITWQQVAVLQSSLPNLQELHAAGNNISSLHVQADNSTSSNHQQQQEHGQEWPPLVGFNSLKVLGLEDNAISSWGEVLRLAGLPQLQRLALSGNPISSITYPCSPVSTAALFSSSTPPGCAEEPPPEQQQQAQQQQQQQHDASVPAAAGEEPSLQPAVNSSNPVGQLQQQSQQQPQSQAPAFASLKALLLGDCRLSSWSDVDELNKLPGLCELRLSGNPLFTAAPADAAEGSCGGTAAAGAGRRFEVIGRVHGLTLLNGADVKPRERRDCELRYLQNVLADEAGMMVMMRGGQQQQQQTQQQQQLAVQQTQQEQQQLAVQHPRLAELKAKYGQVSAVAAVSVAAKQQGSSLRSTTCELLLRCGGTTAKKKLPKSVTVAALRLLCSRLFKIAPDQIQLTLEQQQQSGAAGDEASAAPAAATSSSTPHEQQQAGCGGEDIGLDDTKQLSYWDVADGCVVHVIPVDPDQQRRKREEEELVRQQQHEHRMAQQLQEGEAIRSAAAEK